MADFNSSSTKPVVSVIIPTRDCLPYLPTAIASVEAQTVAGVEILVIDDGSSDGSAEWLRAKQRSSPWLTLIEGFGDGPNTARNRGIEAAAAPLLAFLDADDSWLPGKLGPDVPVDGVHNRARLRKGHGRRLGPSDHHGSSIDLVYPLLGGHDQRPQLWVGVLPQRDEARIMIRRSATIALMVVDLCQTEMRGSAGMKELVR